MKKSILTIAIAGTFAMGSVMLVGCGGGGEAKGGHTEGDEHAEHAEGHDDSGKEEGHGHGEGEEGHSHAAGGHMDHMMDVRAWLKEELGDKYDAVVPEATADQLALGKTKFEMICSACHGMTGKGDGAAAAGLEQKPSDFTDAGHSKYYSDAGRIHIITNGSPGTAMVAWESALSADEIQAVYMYVRSLRTGGGDDDHDHGDGMYTCSMHPEVSGNKGDECPKCSMELIPKEHGHDDAAEEHGHEEGEGHEDGHDHEH